MIFSENGIHFSGSCSSLLNRTPVSTLHWEDFVVGSVAEFGPRLVRVLAWLAGLILLGTVLAFALPTLATL